MLSLLLTQINEYYPLLEAYNKNTIYRTTKDTFKYDLESLIGNNNIERDRLAKEGPNCIKNTIRQKVLLNLCRNIIRNYQ